MPQVITRETLAQWDERDPLAPFRARFRLPAGVIYLDGNSLGPLPVTAIERLQAVVTTEWGEDLIRSWNKNDWIGQPQRLGDKIGRLIGAAPGQVVAADSTSINLYKLLAAALRLRPDRHIIVSQKDNFPTDLYMAQGLAAQLGQGHSLRYADPNDVPASLRDDVAVMMLTHVNYRDAQMYDMAALTKAAHDCGALVIWDLAHSAGAVPVDLDAARVDFAVGCGYKFLNGGPGAPAFLYVAERYQELVQPVLSGWMGHAAPFDFDSDYAPAPGIKRMLCGTPPVLSMAALEVAVDLMLDADLATIREKSLRLTQAFFDLVEQECGDFGFVVTGPRELEKRGSQVSLAHPDGYPIMQALIARGVIGDFRAPDILRFGLTPLYLRYVDLWDAVAILKDIMTTGAWDVSQFKVRAAVT